MTPRAAPADPKKMTGTTRLRYIERIRDATLRDAELHCCVLDERTFRRALARARRWARDDYRRLCRETGGTIWWLYFEERRRAESPSLPRPL